MAQTVNISIDQGATFTYAFTIQTTTLNLVGATANARMVTEYDEPNTTVAFTTSLSGNVLTISLTANQTSNLVANTWVYDAVVTDSSNNVTRVVQGRAWVRPAT